jgi:putative acetyltransferase
MYVEPEARRSGIGRALVAEALARASKMAGVRQVNLGVNAANTEAIALYQRAGFMPFGLELGFMLLEGALHDELHMVFVLPRARL